MDKFRIGEMCIVTIPDECPWPEYNQAPGIVRAGQCWRDICDPKTGRTCAYGYDLEFFDGQRAVAPEPCLRKLRGGDDVERTERERELVTC